MNSEQDEDVVEKLLNSMDWKDHVGQMAQIDINMLLNDDKTALRQDLLDHYIGELGIGSVLNNVADIDHDYWPISKFRQAAIQIQQTAKKFNRPPVIWGLDSVHGANYLKEAITTPQPINIAASFNTTLALKGGQWASRDTRRAGITWLFSPLLGLSWEPLWSRVYETFGEDPVVVGAMAEAMIEGIQQLDDDNETAIIPSRAAACGKHWIGYSKPHNGHDRAPSWIPIRHLYQYFLLPWKRVVGQVDTIMESYTEVDGVPNVANRETLTRILRQELNFDGLLVTDYHEIFNLFEWHHTVRDRTAALQTSFEEGSVDMSMIANEPDDFFNAMTTLKKTTHLQDRVKESARRVLQLKQDMNMFDESFDMENSEDDHLPSESDLDAALEMTHQTIVLTKNDGQILPLNEDSQLKVLVTGPTSNSLSFQTGGWTGQWQGVNSNLEDQWFTYGSTVLQAIRRQENWEVSYSCGVDILGQDCDPDPDLETLQEEQHGGGVMGTIKGWVGWNPGDEISIERSMNSAKDMDVVVICLGEENYTEKPGDIRSLELPVGQYGLVAGIREAAPETKIVLAYFGGRPRLLADVVDIVDAVFVGFLPGPLAGDALADLLTGRVNPSARLPITYPKFQDGGGIPYLHSVSDQCTKDDGGTLPNWENTPCEVQWPFGHGLSYTKFEYENLSLSDTKLDYHYEIKDEPSLTVSVVVKNTGIQAGAETVLFFTFDSFRSTTPEYKRLRGFEKIWLEPGTSTSVSLTIPLDDFRFVGPHDNTHYVLEDGFTFQVGVGSHVDCRSPTDNTAPLCSPPVSISTGHDYVAACEVACNLWKSSGCSDAFSITGDNCWDMCTSIHHNSNGNLQLNNDGWGWNYVECLESITYDNSFDKENDCWKLTTFCRDVLKTPEMDEFGHGATPEAFVPKAGHVTTIVVALIAGVVSSLLVAYAMRGGFRKRDEDFGDVQFSSVRNQDIM